MNRRAQEMVEQSQKITILGERRVCFTDFHTPFGGEHFRTIDRIYTYP